MNNCKHIINLEYMTISVKEHSFVNMNLKYDYHWCTLYSCYTTRKNWGKKTKISLIKDKVVPGNTLKDQLYLRYKTCNLHFLPAVTLPWQWGKCVGLVEFCVEYLFGELYLLQITSSAKVNFWWTFTWGTSISESFAYLLRCIHKFLPQMSFSSNLFFPFNLIFAS